MKRLIVISIALFTTAAFAKTESKEFSSTNLKRLDLKVSSGNINIITSTNNKTYVAVTKKKFEESCKLTVEKSGSTLLVELDKDSWFSFDDCKVDFEIKVPKEIALDLKSGAGNIMVNGTKGEINFHLGAGSATVEAEVEKLTGNSGSGSINVKGLAGDADINTGVGNITLAYKSVLKHGKLDVKTGTGKTEISFPAKMKINTEFKSGMGHAINELGDSSDAKFKVFVRSGTGDLEIKSL